MCRKTRGFGTDSDPRRGGGFGTDPDLVAAALRSDRRTRRVLLLLLADPGASLAALRRFGEHLVPGGRLIPDLKLPSDLHSGPASTKAWRTPTGELITLEPRLVEVDLIEQYTVSHLKYEKWRDGILVRTEL